MSPLHPPLQPGGLAVGLGMPVVISFPGRSPGWSRDATVEDLGHLCTVADSLGYAYVTVSDHPGVPRGAVEAMGDTWYAPLPTLAWIAARTTRLRVCTHVLVIPYRPALLLARDLATLDHLSGGRLILGAGTGHLAPEFRALGIDHAARGATTDATLEEVWRILAGDSRWVVRPGPVQHPRPRTWIGGNTARALRRARALGDGWVPWQVDEQQVRRLLDEHGHPGEVVLPVSLDPLGAAGDTQSPDRMLEHLQRLRDAGATAVTAGFPSRSAGEFVAQMEAFAATVMPSLAAG